MPVEFDEVLAPPAEVDEVVVAPPVEVPLFPVIELKILETSEFPTPHHVRRDKDRNAKRVLLIFLINVPHFSILF